MKFAFGFDVSNIEARARHECGTVFDSDGSQWWIER